MIKISLLFITLINVHGISIEYGQPKAVTKYGEVYGTIRKINIEQERGCLECPEKSVFFFKGIPYAKPPLGHLRFEKPEPLNYFGTVNATELKNRCTDFLGDIPKGQEDCLYMNIATPSFPPFLGRKFPVMVLIFGGGFMHGDANEYQSEDFHYRFVTRGIVCISFHYRLGPLGFYTSENSIAPGNYGMWDQIQGLKFIQEVISNFNGDPKRVTIFGNSAGGGSVSWLTYSHHSKGLFTQALPYCGMSHSLTTRTNNTFIHSREFEVALGCQSAENKKKCLKQKSIDEIWSVSHHQFLDMNNTIYNSRWSPVFDDDLFPGDSWFTASKTAPVIRIFYGLNLNEDAAFVVDNDKECRHAKYYPIDKQRAESFGKEDLVESLTYLLSIDNIYKNRSQEAIQKVIDYYLTQGNENPSHKFIQSYVQFYSDIHYSVGAIREAKQKAKLGNRVYFYLNNYNTPNYPFANPLIVATGHCAENPYLYGNWSGLEPPVDVEGYAEYKRIQKDFVDMWVSFVKYGIPSHSGRFLPRVSPHRVPYALVDNITVMKDNLWRERSAFWETTAREYGFDVITGFPNPY